MRNNIIVFISILIIAYLAGCFIELSFNIADWTEVARVSVVIFGFAIAVMFTAMYDDTKIKNNDYR